MPKAGVVRSKYFPGASDRTDKSVSFVRKKFVSLCLSEEGCCEVLPRKRLSKLCLQIKDYMAYVFTMLRGVIAENLFTKPLLYR